MISFIKSLFRDNTVTADYLLAILPSCLSKGYIGALEWVYKGVKQGTHFSSEQAQQAIRLLHAFGYKESNPDLKHNARTDKEKAEWIIGQALMYLAGEYTFGGVYAGLPQTLKPFTKECLKKIKHKEKTVTS